jgi:hypothetical protein
MHCSANWVGIDMQVDITRDRSHEADEVQPRAASTRNQLFTGIYLTLTGIAMVAWLGLLGWAALALIDL